MASCRKQIKIQSSDVFQECLKVPLQAKICFLLVPAVVYLSCVERCMCRVWHLKAVCTFIRWRWLFSVSTDFKRRAYENDLWHHKCSSWFPCVSKLEACSLPCTNTNKRLYREAEDISCEAVELLKWHIISIITVSGFFNKGEGVDVIWGNLQR